MLEAVALECRDEAFEGCNLVAGGDEQRDDQTQVVLAQWPREVDAVVAADGGGCVKMGLVGALSVLFGGVVGEEVDDGLTRLLPNWWLNTVDTHVRRADRDG